jgi:DHA2 family multidrug resistance protein-like MFS transporter
MTLAIFAALAARVGYRPVFLSGLATFTLTSLGCALATTPEMLTGMRILQGIGGAATLSIAPAILRSVFPGDCWAASGAARPAYRLQHGDAPVLGGTILDALSWQWLFAINLIPGSIALLLAWRACRGNRPVDSPPFDPAGAPCCPRPVPRRDRLPTAFSTTQHISLQAVFWGVLALVSALAFTWRIRRAQHTAAGDVQKRALLAALPGLFAQGIVCRSAWPCFQPVVASAHRWPASC